MEQATPDPIRRALLQHLESLRRAGVTHLPRAVAGPPAVPTAALADAAVPAPEDGLPTAARPSVPPAENRSAMFAKKPGSPLESTAPAPAALSRRQRVEALKVIQEQVQACTRCPELVANRTQTVFGVGNPEARLCFFGEAPGADEDRQGEPFVGRAGQLLTRIIEACSLQRQDVYILNTLKCRPPGNRNPLPAEVENCRGYFERQLAIIQPEFICCLGTIAAQALLDTKLSVGKLRGRFHEFGSARVIATYHPAYLLRNPNAKRLVWDDMKMLMREMGIAIPRSPT